jgi:guanyl-specific ribonuclease Sa
MRAAGSSSKWLVIAIVAILAVFVWTSLREPAPSVPPAAQGPPATQSDNPLETPPPLTPPPVADAKTTASYPDFLPPEAIDTLERIARGGPYPYRQDDGVFQNRERLLSPQPRGYYREYTVDTPGSRDRGARRIVTGGRPPSEYYYTDDHYRSFRRFTLDGSGAGQ